MEANAATLHGDARALRAGTELLLPAPVTFDRRNGAPALTQQVLDQLARILDKRYLALVLYERLTPAQRTAAAALPAELTRLVKDGAVRAALTVDAGAVNRLLGEGLLVTAQNPIQEGKTVLLLAQIPLENLEKVARSAGVRRIEPAEMVPAEAAALGAGGPPGAPGTSPFAADDTFKPGSTFTPARGAQN